MWHSYYAVTKKSWKGKYPRVLCIGDKSIATSKLTSLFDITNSWDYNQILDIQPVLTTECDIKLLIKADSNNPVEIIFSCDSYQHRVELLSSVNRFRPQWDLKWQTIFRNFVLPCKKWSSTKETWSDCFIYPTSVSINITTKELNPLDEPDMRIKTYYLTHLHYICPLSDREDEYALSYGNQQRHHLFYCERMKELIKFVFNCKLKFLGIQSKVQHPSEMTMDAYKLSRFNVDLSRIKSKSEFHVQKTSSLSSKLVPRMLCISVCDKYIIERDSSTYVVTSLELISDIYIIIISLQNKQSFTIQFISNKSKTYVLATHELFISLLMHSCKKVGNQYAYVSFLSLNRRKKVMFCDNQMNEEVEAYLLKCLGDPSKINISYCQIVHYFLANIKLNGIVHSDEKLLHQAIVTLLHTIAQTKVQEEIISYVLSLTRIITSKKSYYIMGSNNNLRDQALEVALKLLRRNDLPISLTVIQFLCTLLSPRHNDYSCKDVICNRISICGNQALLLCIMSSLSSGIRNNSILLVHSILSFLVYALVPPYSLLTGTHEFRYLLDMLLNHVGKDLYYLVNSESVDIRIHTLMIIRVAMEEGSEEQFITLQQTALSTCALLHLLHTSIFYAESSQIIQPLSYRLIALICHNNTIAVSLLHRLLPHTLFIMLETDSNSTFMTFFDTLNSSSERETGPVPTEGFDDLMKSKKSWDLLSYGWYKPTFSPKLQSGENHYEYERVIKVNVSPSSNWLCFFAMLSQDIKRPDLIWNTHTRQELKNYIENEMTQFQHALNSKRYEEPICWNYQEAYIQYKTLSNELKIGSLYINLLLEDQLPSIFKPKELFQEVYQKFLISFDTEIQCQCLKALSILYKSYYTDIGPFKDIEYLVSMVYTTFSPALRDRLFLFINALLISRFNVVDFIHCNGVRLLIDHVSLVHLDITESSVPTDENTIENSANTGLSCQDLEKEWYYAIDGEQYEAVSYTTLKELYNSGIVKSNTLVKAEGLNTWTPMEEVYQLKWGIISASQPAVMTFTELSLLIINLLSTLCAYYPSRNENGALMCPLPTIKTHLSQPLVLARIVQLLLTFKPILCSRVHQLLLIIIEDNPIMNKFFLTGVFYFTLMYTGSDIISMSQLFHATHTKQCFYRDTSLELTNNSILSSLLPPALICLLFNHGPGKFASAFLGDYQNPEVIWNPTMRKFLIHKLSVHISKFTSKLLCNHLIVYQYCPIPTIVYAILQSELFCSPYYLKHLCDLNQFPHWNIPKPVELLGEILKCWSAEMNKKPSSLSVDKCLHVLNITSDNLTTNDIRRAYYKLAPTYHPDRNPEGRAMFDAIQEAYTFLCRESSTHQGPSRLNISLLLETQCILFDRFGDIFSQYRYAGYPLLIAVLKQEYEGHVHGQDIPLIVLAVQLTHKSVCNAVSNIIEIYNEGGIEVLSDLLNKYTEQFTTNMLQSDDACIIVDCILDLFHISLNKPKIASYFIDNFPSVLVHATTCIAYTKTIKLHNTSVRLIQSLSEYDTAHRICIASGAIWHLLTVILQFDATLSDSTVDTCAAHHYQHWINNSAKEALSALSTIAGYTTQGELSEYHSVIDSLYLKLLTPYIVDMMKSNANKEEILYLLNTGANYPEFYWTKETKNELLMLVTDYSEYCRDHATLSNLDTMPSLSLETFYYALHKNELIIGGIFVRIYIDNPQYKLKNPSGFMTAMFHWLIANEQPEYTNDNINMVIYALQLLIKHHTVDVSTYSHVLFHLIISDVITADTANNCCALLLLCLDNRKCITHAPIVTAMFPVFMILLRQGKVHMANIIQLYTRAVCSPAIYEALIYSYFTVALLYLFVFSGDTSLQESICQCINRILSDVSYKSIVTLHYRDLIPSYFIDLLESDPNQCVVDYRENYENPDIIWNDTSRSRSQSRIAVCYEALQEAVQSNTTEQFSIECAIANQLPFSDRNDLYVGGIYIELYLRQPSWPIKNTKQFIVTILTAFIDTYRSIEHHIESNTAYIYASIDESDELTAIDKTSEFQQELDKFSLISKAVVAFLSQQSYIINYLLSLGYLESLFNLLKNKECMEDTAESIISILYVISSASSSIAMYMVSFDPVHLLMGSLTNTESIVLTMNTLTKIIMCTTSEVNIVRLALNNKLLEGLLILLETGLSNTSNASTNRAVIATLIQTIEEYSDPTCKAEVNDILENSPIWADFKDQNYELFVNNKTIDKYITYT